MQTSSESGRFADPEKILKRLSSLRREERFFSLDAFAPELILVSAGFDAHRADPLAGLELEEADFAWVTQRLTEAAARHAQGRLISVLEGGYNLRALAGSAAAHVGALMTAN